MCQETRNSRNEQQRSTRNGVVVLGNTHGLPEGHGGGLVERSLDLKLAAGLEVAGRSADVALDGRARGKVARPDRVRGIGVREPVIGLKCT